MYNTTTKFIEYRILWKRALFIHTKSKYKIVQSDIVMVIMWMNNLTFMLGQQENDIHQLYSCSCVNNFIQ